MRSYTLSIHQESIHTRHFVFLVVIPWASSRRRGDAERKADLAFEQEAAENAEDQWAERHLSGFAPWREA